MARIHVKVLGALAKPFGKDDLDFDVAPGEQLEAVLVRLGYHPSHLRFIIPSVNGKQQPLGCTLNEGDELVLVLPTSGG